MKKGRLLILGLLVLSISLLFFSASVCAKIYYLEDECIIFVKADKLVYFSILDRKFIGGYTIETDISKMIAIKQGVEHTYYNEETGETQTEIQTQIVIRDISPGVKTRVISFGKSKTGIGIFFTFSTENSEKNL